MTQHVNEKKKAIFLDRDGIINEDTEYPYKPEHIQFKDGIFAFCRSAAQKGYLLVVITNQAGIAKGIYTEQDVQFLHKWMDNKFREQGIAIAGFYYCPYHKDGVIEKYRKDSELRKPKPGMVLQAIKDLNIDITQSKMIGDKESDRIALDGLQSIIVKSRYLQKNYDVVNLQDIESML